MVKNKPIKVRRGVKGNSWSSIRMIQSSFKPIDHEVRWITVFLEFQFLPNSIFKKAKNGVMT